MTTGLGWFLAVRVEHATEPSRSDRRSRNPARRNAVHWSEARHEILAAARAGMDDMRARAPGSSLLSDKAVVVIGCGAIGGVVVEQLARAGVGALTLIDADQVEPGNLARHAATMNHVGLPKAAALAELARQVNPYVHVDVHHSTFGGAEIGQREEISRVLDQADLVVDATAEVAIQELSSRLASEARLPWVMLEATNGAWGGVIVAVPASSPWCFACYEWFRAEGEIPQPPTDDAAPIQPAGCAEPTFVAAQYDLAEVSLQAVRTIVQFFDAGQPEPPAVAVVSMNTDGVRTPPQWKTADMAHHSRCSCVAT